MPIPRRNPDGTKTDAATFLVRFLRELVEPEEDDLVPGTNSS